MPKHKYAYISAEAESAVTISGPPSTLNQLFATSHSFSGARKIIPLPITAAFHAGHLQRPDADNIIGSSALFDRPIIERRQIISTHSGMPYGTDNFRKVLHLMIDDILTNSLLYNETIEAIVSTVKNGEVTLMSFGPTNATQSLKRSLQKVGFSIMEHSSLFSSPTYVSTIESSRSGSGAIAVIGMATRLPGSETLEEFWDILEKGKDLVQEVISSQQIASNSADFVIIDTIRPI